MGNVAKRLHGENHVAVYHRGCENEAVVFVPKVLYEGIGLKYIYYIKYHRVNTLGINYDPSHLVWQGVNEAVFIREMAKRIYHVHLKDVKLFKNELAGILGSFLPFGDTRRAWNFVSLGHGDTDFDGIIRELNVAGYTGPLSVEWEDSGMDRFFGAAESCAYAKRVNFSASTVGFDEALKRK
jgi:hypothetical protein